ncbi:MAG: HEAT repeat domain-containing protein [Acidimicrobiia bacterium]|nr:HEAT repeat domain-containing protein [Acidimicrobiia bacterium]
MTDPLDLDATRSAIAARDLTATASGYLTTDVAMRLPFEALGPFKTLLRRFFSAEAFTAADRQELSDTVTPHIEGGWWEHDLGGGITLAHGVTEGRYVIRVSGAASPAPSVFARVFDGPVVPEATPHPRKVKFVVGGPPAPGKWYLRHDADTGEDARVARLFAEPDVTDVMVAGDFVTVGIGSRASWERRLEPLLALVTELFLVEGLPSSAPERTRDELLDEARRSTGERPEELHLLDPDLGPERVRLLAAIDSDDPRVRRVALAILLESTDSSVRAAAVEQGMGDPSRIVRRATIDSAADSGLESFRPVFEAALRDEDGWIRWKAVRALGELRVGTSRPLVEEASKDADFQVRFEAARVLKRG